MRTWKTRVWGGLTALALTLGLCTPLAGLLPEARAAETVLTEGSWGSLSWRVEGEVLYVEGTGAMPEAEFGCDVSPETGIYHTNDGSNWSYYPWDNYAYLHGDEAVRVADFSAVVIGEGITTVSTGAFYDYGLRSVTLPSTLTSIGDYAFGENTELGTVDIPASVTEIGMYAFHATTARAEEAPVLAIPAGVETIGAYAFSDNAYTQITFSEGLRSLGEGAFWEGTDRDFAGFSLPASVTDIGSGAFCTSASYIEAAEGNSCYTDIDGVLYSADQTLLHSFPRSWTGDTIYEIPETVTALEPYAFAMAKLVSTIYVPEGVKEIPEGAFYGCEALQRVFLPEGVETIGDVAFSQCESMDYIELPDSVTVLGTEAFSGCSSLDTASLSAGLTAISPGLFLGCSDLVWIKIPSGVTVIGEEAFSGCSSLIDVSLSAGLTTVEDAAFSGCKMLWHIVFPSSLTKLGASAFEDAGLTSADLPGSVTSLGEAAFSGCPLTQVTLPDGLTELPASLFDGCGTLTAIDIPDSVRKVGARAFASCGFVEIAVPEGVETLSDSAFRYCSALEEIQLPASLKAVEAQAFSGCGKLEKVQYGGTCAAWDRLSISESGNDPLLEALVYCIDGYYGTVTGDIAPDMQAEVSITSGILDNLLPLYSEQQGFRFDITLNGDWVQTHPEDFDEKTASFSGSVKLMKYDGTVLYEKQGLTYQGISGGTASLYSLFEFAELTERPLSADSLLTLSLYDSKGAYIDSAEIRTSFQRWSFKNYNVNISDNQVKDVFGDFRGWQLLQQAKNSGFNIGSEGLCFGMAVVTSLVNAGYLPVSIFDGCEVLDQVQKETVISNESGTWNADKLIQVAHLLQYKESVQKQLDEHIGDCQGLMAEIDRFKAGTGSMPLIYITDGSVHTLCAYDYTDGSNTVEFKVYDVSIVNRLGVVQVRKNSGDWEYLGMDWSGTQGTFTYFTASDGVAWIDQGADHALLRVRPDFLAIPFDPNRIAISWIANGTGEREAGAEEQLYWVSGSEPVELTGPGSIADSSALYEMASGDSCTFFLKEDEVTHVTAEGEALELRCEYTGADGTHVAVSYAGGGAPVTLTYHPDDSTVTFSGMKDGTVTVSYYEEEPGDLPDSTWTQAAGSGSLQISAGGSGAPVFGTGGSGSGTGTGGSGSSGSAGSGGSSRPGTETIEPGTPPTAESPAFTDVDPDAWYYDAVQWAVEQGITNGTSAGVFSPDRACTRAEVVTFLWRALGADSPAGSTANPFRDVPDGAYYCDAVLWAVENGITNGTAADTFSPGQTCTRGETVTFLWRALGADSPAGSAANPFRDVPGSAYYCGAVLWAVEHGITNGTSASTFSPGQTCTRAQVAAFLCRCCAGETDATP